MESKVYPMIWRRAPDPDLCTCYMSEPDPQEAVVQMRIAKVHVEEATRNLAGLKAKQQVK